MRNLALWFALLAACGSSSSKPKDSGGGSAGSDAPNPFDAPSLAACTPTSGMTMSTRMIGRVSGVAIVATSPPNDGRLFVIEQGGRIRIFQNEQLVATPFLDISSKVQAGGEEGLLGLAFHPNYANNNYFYVWYTAANPNASDSANPIVDVLERYTASSTDLNTADPNSGKIILSVPDPFSNHNGGMLEFGSDGMLYVGTGDGGSAGDPNHNAQTLDPTTQPCAGSNNCQPLLGKVLRLDVDHPGATKPYGIPADNPFKTSPTPEAFIVGVRNPWRWTFDRGTGDMWIADVGQNDYEELDALPAGQQAGLNLGWSIYEGMTCCNTEADKCSQGAQVYTCDTAGKTFPQFVHTHTAGWNAIIGGQVYRGGCYPDLVGYYFFSDNGSHVLMRTRAATGGGIDTPVDVTPSAGFPAGPSSIHADARGELYVTTTDGYVYHLEAGP